MPPKKPKPQPPLDSAPDEEHKKYAQEFLEDPEYLEKPKDYQDRNDEAKE
jgi:hypothetical protein